VECCYRGAVVRRDGVMMVQLAKNLPSADAGLRALLVSAAGRNKQASGGVYLPAEKDLLECGPARTVAVFSPHQNTDWASYFFHARRSAVPLL
jgi:hypothetical protein